MGKKKGNGNTMGTAANPFKCGKGSDCPDKDCRLWHPPNSDHHPTQVMPNRDHHPPLVPPHSESHHLPKVNQNEGLSVGAAYDEVGPIESIAFVRKDS